MLNPLQNVGDDQTALIGCIVTLAISSLFIFASFHLGPAGQKLRNKARIAGTTETSDESFKTDRSHERAA